MTEERGNAALSNYQLISGLNSDGLHVGYLAIREVPEGFDLPSKYGFKATVSGSYASWDKLADAAKMAFMRYCKGEISTDAVPVEREKLRGYRLLGTARFQTISLKWESMLEIKKMEEPNRGAKQSVMGKDTVFPRNLFRSPDLAARFAIDFGKGMVSKTVLGLLI